MRYEIAAVGKCGKGKMRSFSAFSARRRLQQHATNTMQRGVLLGLMHRPEARLNPHKMHQNTQFSK